MKDFARKSDAIDRKRSLKKSKHNNDFDFNSSLSDVLPLIFSLVPDSRHKGTFSMHTVCKAWDTILNNTGHHVAIDSIQELLSDISSEDEILLFLHDHGKQLDSDMIAAFTAKHKKLACSIIEEALLIPGFNSSSLLVLTTVHSDIARKLVNAFFLEEYQYYFVSNKVPFKGDRLDDAVANAKRVLANNPDKHEKEILLAAVKAYEDGALPLASDNNLFAFAFCQMKLLQHRPILTIDFLTEREKSKNFICSYVVENFSKLRTDSLHPMSLRAKPIIKYPK